jgi:phenylacetate-CoA ligase
VSVKSRLLQSKFFIFRLGYRAFVRCLEESETLSAAELAALNWSKRKQLITFCYENIPFYQRRFREAGFEPGDLKNETDFARLPILEKSDIRENEDGIVNPACQKGSLGVSTTGGTTGSPLKTYYDPAIPLSIASWRALRWWGCDPSDNSGYLYRAIPKGCRRLLQDIVLWPTQRCYLGASDMAEDNMRRFFARLRRVHPRYLVGYVGALDSFATFLLRNGLSLAGLKAVWTTSSPLPEIKRKFMQEIYDCPVYTQYGSCEFYWIAAECRAQAGLHIASDIRHVEVVQEDAPVEEGLFGELLVTDLINYAFPLVRYRLGDRGRLLKHPCQCGRNFPLMDYVRGRISDSIYLPDGSQVPGEYWTTIFDDYTDVIKSFRIIQRGDYSIQVLFEPFRDDYARTIEVVSRVLRGKLGNKVPVVFRRTVIDVNENGKTHFVKSEIQGRPYI